ncbi:MAG: DUF6614 family protein [Paracoccaceae bacterium]
MNLYVCQIDLKQEAKALVFANALEIWMSHLQSNGTILSWQLYRRKLNLASDSFRDFELQVEVENLSQLDLAFRLSGQQDDDVQDMYNAVHNLIAASDFGLFRPFPDPERSERMALL